MWLLLALSCRANSSLVLGLTAVFLENLLTGFRAWGKLSLVSDSCVSLQKKILLVRIYIKLNLFVNGDFA